MSQHFQRTTMPPSPLRQCSRIHSVTWRGRASSVRSAGASQFAEPVDRGDSENAFYGVPDSPTSAPPRSTLAPPEILPQMRRSGLPSRCQRRHQRRLACGGAVLPAVVTAVSQRRVEVLTLNPRSIARNRQGGGMEALNPLDFDHRRSLIVLD